jgi:glycosyltransferase involved in cell wall biosynthesis
MQPLSGTGLQAALNHGTSTDDRTVRSAQVHAMTPRPVLVLLPVYNGARFLQAQLDSILQQSHPALLVVCRDDGSSDGSIAVLDAAARRWPDRIILLQDDRGNLGARGNFALLLQHALNLALPAPLAEMGAPCVALCDQDDVWHPDKLATCVAELNRLEQEQPGRPALVHSDLRVVEEDGALIAPSMARYQGLQTGRPSFAAQLLSNTLTGCTALMNMPLVRESMPIPEDAIMHDWWLSLVASAWGKRSYLDQALIDYRQHHNNTIGAKAHEKAVLKGHFLQRLFDARHADIFRLNARQARAFRRRYRGRLGLRRSVELWVAQALAIPLPPLQRVLYTLLRRA